VILYTYTYIEKEKNMIVLVGLPQGAMGRWEKEIEY
jgi:hypothetical protein